MATWAPLYDLHDAETDQASKPAHSSKPYIHIVPGIDVESSFQYWSVSNVADRRVRRSESITKCLRKRSVPCKSYRTVRTPQT